MDFLKKSHLQNVASLRLFCVSVWQCVMFDILYYFLDCLGALCIYIAVKEAQEKLEEEEQAKQTAEWEARVAAKK